MGEEREGKDRGEVVICVTAVQLNTYSMVHQDVSAHLQ